MTLLRTLTEHMSSINAFEVFHYILTNLLKRISDTTSVPYQDLLQLQAWVSANGVLKDCMIKVCLGYSIRMKY